MSNMLYRIINKEIRANVRMSSAGEVVLTYRGVRGVCNSIFFTVDETRALVRALEDAQREPMKDFEILWSEDRTESA